MEGDGKVAGLMGMGSGLKGIVIMFEILFIVRQWKSTITGPRQTNSRTNPGQTNTRHGKP